MTKRYDIVFSPEGLVYPESHFCRYIDCFGSNEDHGYSWEEAKEQMILYYKSKVEEWENMEENDYD